MELIDILQTNYFVLWFDFMLGVMVDEDNALPTLIQNFEEDHYNLKSLTP